ncbi:hypothetical protein F4561_002979 [Lipingzhangella halophila]|uniref:Uncharacterized protein n=1 Tax=Lipingzhangella halophila TaxID=1783352 RepID=A0A7W7W3U1_9ACTN|nr:hypothetical protein [Lipingzhangella halophila]
MSPAAGAAAVVPRAGRPTGRPVSDERERPEGAANTDWEGNAT